MCISGMGTPAVAKVALLAVVFHLSTAYISLDDGPPGEVVADVGDTVTLVCDLRDVGNSQIRWYHHRAGHFLSLNRGIQTDLPEALAERLEVVGNPDKEQFNLRIRDFGLSDLGTYSCYYMYPAMLIRKIATTVLTLHVPASDSPKCIVEPAPGEGDADADVAVADQVTLWCITGGASSQTVIEYHRGDSQIDLASSSTGQLAFQRQLVPEDNGVDFTCIMSSSGQEGPRSCSVRPLEILPTARVTPPVLSIDEGTGASLVCEASGIPSIASYRWEVRATTTGEELPLGQDMDIQGVHLMSISQVTEDITATCIVTTPNGLSNNSSAKIAVIKSEAPILTTIAEKDFPTTVTKIGTTVIPNTTPPSASDTVSTNGDPVPAISTMPAETNNQPRVVTNQPIDGPFTTIVVISAALATAAVVALLVVLICYCCVWRRKKSSTQPARYTMVELGAHYEDVLPSAADDATVDQRGNTYQEVPATSSDVPAEQRGNTYEAVPSSYTSAPVSVVERGNMTPTPPMTAGASTSTLTSAQPGANAAGLTPLYAVPKKPKRGTPRNLAPDDQLVVRSSVDSQYATPKKPRPIGQKRRPSASSRKPAPMPRRVPTDNTLYAKPRKLSQRIKNKIRWGLDKNGYRIAESDNHQLPRRAPDRDTVYTDVDISPAGVVTVGVTPKPQVTGEPTLYAQIT